MITATFGIPACRHGCILRRHLLFSSLHKEIHWQYVQDYNYRYVQNMKITASRHASQLCRVIGISNKSTQVVFSPADDTTVATPDSHKLGYTVVVNSWLYHVERIFMFNIGSDTSS